MAKTINEEILLLLLVAAVGITQHSTHGAEHLVQWIIPADGASFYSDHLANTTFAIDDILVLNFTTGFHNVVTLSKKDYEKCSVKRAMETYNTGPAKIKLNRTGEFYFACAFTSHCSLGQKLAINVGNSSHAMGPAAHAPSSMASPFIAPSSLVVMAIAIGVLSV